MSSPPLPSVLACVFASASASAIVAAPADATPVAASAQTTPVAASADHAGAHGVSDSGARSVGERLCRSVAEPTWPAGVPTPGPVVMPAPTPTPLPLGPRFDTSATLTAIDQSTAGAGQTQPEDAGFIVGSPLAPQAPYHLFSSAPQVPGVAGIGSVVSTGTDRTRDFEAGFTASATSAAA